MTPTTAAVTQESAAFRPRCLPQGLDVRRADEDEREARHERHPGRQARADARRRATDRAAGVAIRRNEADELQHHDQRPWRSFGHREAVDHFAGCSQCSSSTARWPMYASTAYAPPNVTTAVLTEDRPFARQHVIGAEPRGNEHDWRQPDQETDRCQPQCPRSTRSRVRELSGLVHAIDDEVLSLARSRRGCLPEIPRHDVARDDPTTAAPATIHGNGTLKK